MREGMKSAWLIAAAVLVPLMLFMMFQSGFAAREERRATESNATTEARSVVFAADALLEHSIGAIEALSTSEVFPAGDLPGAYRRSREIAAFNKNWASVELRRASDSAVLFDLRRPLGTAIPAARRREVPQGTVVGPVVRSGAGCPCVTIERAAPGPDGGYVLTALLSVEPFLALLPPASNQYTVSAIVSADGSFVARTLDQDERVGTQASRSLRDAIAGGKATGTYRGFTLEGLANYSAFAARRAPAGRPTSRSTCVRSTPRPSASSARLGSRPCCRWPWRSCWSDSSFGNWRAAAAPPSAASRHRNSRRLAS